MGNKLDYIFMESYSSRKTLISVKYTLIKGLASKNNETREISKQILNIIPSEISFTIKNNIAVSLEDYVDNNISISELLCCEGLNNSHYIIINREQHLLISKVNFYTSTGIFY